MLKAKLLGATAGAVESTFIEDVFSTYLYAGGSAQQINNGIDLATEGGMAWIKRRNSTANAHHLFDTQRTNATYGTPTRLSTNTTSAADVYFTTGEFSWLTNGFNLNNIDVGVNGSGFTYASWTFRKAPRFFDVVTYTGTGANRTIAHDLGVVPGCIIVKRTDTTGAWQVYHRSLANTEYLVLNTTAAKATGATRWNSTTPTSSVFSLGTDATVNASGGTYVAYLFAHDPLGPSGDGSDGLIACGSYVGTGSTRNNIDLGFEPQWLLIKRASSTESWWLFDNMRGLPTFRVNSPPLWANSSNDETTIGVTDWVSSYQTGFSSEQTSFINNSGETFVYIAIRRGPMREPTVGTEVFSPNAVNVSTGTAITTGFPVDLQIFSLRTGTTNKNNVYDRLRGVSTNTTESGVRLITNSTAAETAAGNETLGWDNTGFKMTSVFSSTSDIFWNFRRAPGFFDVVAYTGTGANRTVSHNLGAAPELMIVKKRSAVDNWTVYAGDATDYLILNSTAATADLDTMWNDTAPTSSVFSLGTNDDVNGNTATFIAYLFASLPGISKVGSYTGNGSNQTINCGFTTGARFILIKRTDSTGDWYVWDTARGIVSGNDPHLSLNTTAAEVTTNDTIDPDNSGFIVNQVAATNVNVNAATYIYLAIA